MIFYVFSFNRGQFLENCVRSIEDCAPQSSIVIFDDRSNDPDTVDTLKRLAGKHRVVSSQSDPGHKHGGLYANMQFALEAAPDDTILCFIQDDTQLVRKLTDPDQKSILEAFNNRPDLGFISPAFIRGIALQNQSARQFDYDPDVNLLYWRESRRSAGVYYSDIFMTTARRLRSRQWRFQAGEPANQRQAQSIFSRMGYLPCPFIMWLPYGTAYRGKQKTLALRLAEKIRHCGFHPFRYMQDSDVDYLRSQSPPTLPIAEEFLSTTRGELKKPWIYDPLQNSSALKHLNRVELYLRSAFPLTF